MIGSLIVLIYSPKANRPSLFQIFTDLSLLILKKISKDLSSSGNDWPLSHWISLESLFFKRSCDLKFEHGLSDGENNFSKFEFSPEISIWLNSICQKALLVLKNVPLRYLSYTYFISFSLCLHGNNFRLISIIIIMMMMIIISLCFCNNNLYQTLWQCVLGKGCVFVRYTKINRKISLPIV